MLFDSTVRRELSRSFGATLVVILTIVITMMLIRVLGLAANGNVAPQDVVLLLAYTALGHLPTMLALALFIAVVVSLGRMYRDSEMAVWFSSGVGLTQFLRPVLRMAAPVLVLVALLLLFVWPWGKRSGDELRRHYEQRSDLSRVAPGVFQTSRDGSRVFFVDSASQQGVEGHNVFVLSNRAGVESVTTARSGRVVSQGEDRVLRLEQGQRNESQGVSGERTLTHFERYEVLVGETAMRATRDDRPAAMDTLELLRDPVPANQGELAWRFGLLLAACNLVVLGVGLAATQPRRPSNWNLLLALLGFVTYFNLITLSQVWVAAGRVPMPWMLLLLHGGMLALALGLIAWRDRGPAGWGSLLQGLRRRAPAAAA